MEIKILGTNCAKCRMLEANVRMAIKDLALDLKIRKVTDFKEIIAYGIMQIPILVVDEEIKSSGEVLTVDEIKKIIELTDKQ